MECDCTTCDHAWKIEYQAWKESVDEYVVKNNMKGTIDEAITYLHMPINLLRLPCKKGKYVK